ncbi:hypothetical protein Dimus_035415, partial [Dionaea muscipula]
MMPRKKLKALRNYSMRFQQATPGSTQQKDKEPSGVDPSGPTAEMLEFPSSSRLERKRANRFHDESEKAKAENAKLLALTSQNPNQTPSLVSI